MEKLNSSTAAERAFNKSDALVFWSGLALVVIVVISIIGTIAWVNC